MKGQVLTLPDEGWSWMTMLASFVCHFLNGGILFSAGVIHVSLLERFNENNTKTSWAGGLCTFFMSSAGIIGSCLINLYSCRIALMVGSVLMTVGLMASAFLQSLELVILSYGCVAGIGSGIVYTTQLVVIGLNFKRKRNFAAGVATGGAGLGAFAIVPVVQVARMTYGNAGMFIILAGISLNICVAGSVMFPSYLENQLKLSKKEMSASANRNKMVKCFQSVTLLRNISFLSFCLSLLSFHVGLWMIFLHLTNYSITMNSTESMASFLMAINGLFSCFSRLLTGLASNADNIDEFVFIFGTFFVIGILTILLPFYGKFYSGQIVFAVCMGLYSGCCYPLLNTVTTRIVGVANLASAFGIEMMFCGVSALFGPTLAGVIVDNGGTYELSFTIAGFSIIIGGFFVMSSTCFKRPQSDTEVKQDLEIKPEEQKLTLNGLLKIQLARENVDIFVSTPYGSSLSLN